MIKNKYQSLNEKNKRMVKMAPRVAVMMIFTIYFAGIIQTTIDVIIMCVCVIVIGLMLFFIPIDKLLNFNFDE